MGETGILFCETSDKVNTICSIVCSDVIEHEILKLRALGKCKLKAMVNSKRQKPFLRIFIKNKKTRNIMHHH